MLTLATLPGPADFPAWRDAARGLLAAGIPPEAADWRIAGDAPGLFAEAPAPTAAPATAHVPRAFVDLSEIAIRHRDPERFALLYRVLWRLAHGERGLIQTPTDPDIIRLDAMAKSVRRDAHKMHAFVRFRQVETETGPRHVAWFEPEHHIEEAEAGFFLRRFAGLRWSIVTPKRSLAWDGEALAMGPGGHRADVPPDDAVEPLWRAYYAAIFNPARLKPGAMRAEMPRKYWRNLPETAEIPRLMREAPRRAAEMVARGGSPPNPTPQRPAAAPPALATDPQDSLAALLRDLATLDALPDFARHATQPVPGEGPLGAPLMVVGEQPGEEEDVGGRPFIGPAGRLFDRAVAEAGIPRAKAYVTNAVKHFKFTRMGQRRLHQSPDAGEVVHYRPFLLREIALVRPRLLLALGGTALRALMGRPLPVLKSRGTTLPGPGGIPVFVTVHPSYLLRLPDEAAQERAYRDVVADLRAAAALAWPAAVAYSSVP